MSPQERDLRVTVSDTEEAFVAETVVQLWQREEGDELVVYCSSPRACMTPPAELCLKPFSGRVEGQNEETMQQDCFGYLRGSSDPLLDADMVCHDGWRPAPVSQDVRGIHGTGRIIEMGRLSAPKREVAVVTACCKSAVSGASVSVDGKVCGITSAAGDNVVSCFVRAGERSVSASHWLSLHGVETSINVSSTFTCGVELTLSPDRLRFYCVESSVAFPDSPQGGRGTLTSADLWLVAGDLNEWRASKHGPHQDAEVWLWDGELHGLGSNNASVLRVEAGEMNMEALALLSSIAAGEQSQCPLSKALTSPLCTYGPWQVVIHPTTTRERCVICELGTPCSPPIWLARLSQSSKDSCDASPVKKSAILSRDPTSRPQVIIRRQCCGVGFEGTKISINGSSIGETDEDGKLALPLQQSSRDKANNTMHMKIDGVPASLLPGNVCEYVICADIKHDIGFDMACLLWIYWCPPERPDSEYGDDPDWEGDASEEEVAECAVCVTASGDQVPDEALPIAGILECPGIRGQRVILDGQSIGPYVLHPASGSQCSHKQCFLSGLVLRPEQLDGYRFRLREPSPFQEHCDELGGCETQRLAENPKAIGFLTRSSN